MPKLSAGILMYRYRQNELQVLLVHPGGPFWARKDAGSWSVPKGEYGPGEDPLKAAIREFEEETGTKPKGRFIALPPVQQKSGKTVQVWAVEGSLDVAHIKSNTFETEWPPKSGKMKTFPEVDRAEWFSLAEASVKLLEAQRPLLTAVAHALNTSGRSGISGG